ncbi:MAG TPA: hypothetical protein VN732_04845 [Solirubrobacterales bacterium]|nr:hypothetical protein [Solirubrobacterales bacterium]
MKVRARTSIALLLLALVAMLLTSGSALAASPIGKDGRIHACYKAKGKGKGTLRVVRSAKVKCPKKWKKVAWAATGIPGPAGEAGARGETGAAGATGEAGPQGLPGRNENVVVNELEDKVTELLTRVKQLEALIPAVTALCGQTKALTQKSGDLGTALGGLSAIIGTLTVLALPSIPTALPPFQCP